jgi:hypothetical protein
MVETNDAVEKEGPKEGVSGEAIAVMIDLGICPGNACPRAVGRCDPKCPALLHWSAKVIDG